MVQFVNAARMTVTAAPGTGTFLLASPVQGFQSFAAGGATNGGLIPYRAEDGVQWEIGYGAYTASPASLARTTIIASSAAGMPITASINTVVYSTILAGDFVPTGGPNGGAVFVWQLKMALASLSQITAVNAAIPSGIGDTVHIAWNNGVWTSEGDALSVAIDAAIGSSLRHSAYVAAQSMSL